MSTGDEGGEGSGAAHDVRRCTRDGSTTGGARSVSPTEGPRVREHARKRRRRRQPDGTDDIDIAARQSEVAGADRRAGIARQVGAIRLFAYTKSVV